MDDELSIKLYELDELENWLEDIERASYYMFIIAAFLILMGIVWWVNSEENDNKIQIRQNLDKPTYSDDCQSCGKKFNSIVKYGSGNNGNKNYHFCIDCYKNGSFTNTEITLNEIRKQRRKELEQKKYSKLRIKIILLQISSLDRWK